MRPSRPPVHLAQRAVITIAVSLLAGCAWLPWTHHDHAAASSPAHASVSAPELSFDHVELRRLGCISGGCPTYSVIVSGDGEVRYHGYSGVAVTGVRNGHANPAGLRALRRLLADTDVVWLESRYNPGHDNCGAWSMNDSAVTLQIDAAQLHKHIEHYLGCHSAPALLVRLENAVDRAAADAAWVDGGG